MTGKVVAGKGAGMLAGKRGLVLGVANNRSIAWGIAKQAAEQGAELAFTFQGEALGKRVRPLAEELGAKVVGHCDVTDAASIDSVFKVDRGGVGRARLHRPLCRFFRPSSAHRSLRRHDGRQFRHDDDDLLLLLHGCGAARREVDEERWVDVDADLLWRRKMDAALQCHGCRQGGALEASVMLSCRRSRREEHPRQRDLRRSDQDTRSLRHR